MTGQNFTSFPLWYTGIALDRESTRRKDEDWIAALLADAATLFVPVWRQQNLFMGDEAVFLSLGDAGWLIDETATVIYLGRDQRGAVFGVDVSHHDPDILTARLKQGQFIDLRQRAGMVDRSQAALLAYARGMAHWQATHRYCGACGSPTLLREGGHVRLCSNPACAREIYPRTDPAVIMLVEYWPDDGAPPSCLLANHARSPQGIYSTLAGFVEPGESLEEAVAREVAEESGVPIDRAVYQASQPWPFPASIMLGFRARAVEQTIRIDPSELNHADWFTPDQVRAAGDWGDEDRPLRLPRRDSISRFLIDEWLRDAAAAGF